MRTYLATVKFSRGENAIRFTVKAATDTQAERKARMLVNKLGKRPTAIEITEA